MTAGVPGATTYVIDPCFREQFEIANPTPNYSALLAEVPREFVGTQECVSKLVTLLSVQIKRSFQVNYQQHPSSVQLFEIGKCIARAFLSSQELKSCHRQKLQE